MLVVGDSVDFYCAGSDCGVGAMVRASGRVLARLAGFPELPGRLVAIILETLLRKHVPCLVLVNLPGGASSLSDSIYATHTRHKAEPTLRSTSR